MLASGKLEYAVRERNLISGLNFVSGRQRYNEHLIKLGGMHLGRNCCEVNTERAA
jgi:hypothetical protein